MNNKWVIFVVAVALATPVHVSAGRGGEAVVGAILGFMAGKASGGSRGRSSGGAVQSESAKAFRSYPKQVRKQIQMKLKEQGHYTSTIDGAWGRGTSNALTSYAIQKNASHLLGTTVGTNKVIQSLLDPSGSELQISSSPGVSPNPGVSTNKAASVAPADAEILKSIPKGKKAGRYDVAVLVANKNYRVEGVPSVDYAVNDLSTMKEHLVKAMGYDPENILVQKDATKGDFEKLFGSKGKAEGLVFNYLEPNKSRVFIYYVGHGAPDPDTGEGYFVPVDADPDYIASSGYAVSTFYENMKKLPAKDMVVVIDSCFSGRTKGGVIFKNVSPAMLKTKEISSGISSGTVMTSAGPDQLSTWYPEKGHSLYSYYFFKGLQGEADENNDKKITTGEMDEYLSLKVRRRALRLSNKKQNPKIEGRDDIVLATYE